MREATDTNDALPSTVTGEKQIRVTPLLLQEMDLLIGEGKKKKAELKGTQREVEAKALYESIAVDVWAVRSTKVVVEILVHHIKNRAQKLMEMDATTSSPLSPQTPSS